MNTDLHSGFYAGKRVLVTGHTGFKGSWLCAVLANAGATVTGYALEPPTQPSLFELARISDLIDSRIGDVRDIDGLRKVFDQAKPEIVLHLAAQPLVRESYKRPVDTYATNVMGTVNVLECARLCGSVRSVLNVTTDKVYENMEWAWGYRENDRLDGYDPYSNSKSCSELVTHSYDKCFFRPAGIALSTARAGNVIGGGDFADNRIIPDCIRAVERGEKIIVRNPHSTRPYQHVLEPLNAYLMIAMKQYEDISYSGCYNVGPDDCDCLTTGRLTDLFCRHWGEGAAWEDVSEQNAPHEAGFLKLDCSLIKSVFGWSPTWHIDETMNRVVEWTKVYMGGGDVLDITMQQINEYLSQNNSK